MRVPLGQSRKVTFRLFSMAPVENWYLLEAEYRATGTPRTLDYAFDKPSGNNGAVITLTLTRRADGPLAGGATVVSILSSSTPTVAGPTGRHWTLFVGN
jgi:hypothetical protein